MEAVQTEAVRREEARGRRMSPGALVVLTLGMAFLLGASPAAPGPGSARAEESVRAHGKVISRDGQSVRSLPTTASARIGQYPRGARVALACKVRRENVRGNDIWYRLDGLRGWMSARYVKNTSPVPYCETTPPRPGGPGPSSSRSR